MRDDLSSQMVSVWTQRVYDDRIRERLLSIVCALALVFAPLSMTSGCVEDRLPTPREQNLDEIQAELNGLIEEGLAAQVPPPIPEDELAVYRLRQHRVQVADEMAAQAAVTLAPLAAAAALFAPEGAADLLLSIVPVQKLSRARHLARIASDQRKRQSRSLLGLRKKFEAALPDEAREFVRLAEVMTRADRRALRLIHRHTSSEKLLRTLMNKQVRGHAEVTWIAGKLRVGKLNGAFARRFTFDADFVDHFTRYEANPSWRVLQDIVEGRTVAAASRDSLASKVVGLLGERTASEIVHSGAFRSRFLQGMPARSGRGISYGQRGSIDIVAYSDVDEAVFIEVKNWSVETWATSGNRTSIIAQLRRHNAGVGQILSAGGRSRRVAGKVLMVAGEGFRGWGDNDLRGEFVETIQELGWTLEKIPDRRIPSFDQLIDNLR